MGAFPPDFDQLDDDRKAGALLDHVAAGSRSYSQQRARAFTAREGLIALEFEALLVTVAAGNLANGVTLSDEDRARLRLASARITAIMDEATG